MNGLYRVGILGTLAVAMGCSGGNNPAAPAVDSTGKHPAGWVVGHRPAYHAAHDQCGECHGVNLDGGITRIDCSNQGNDGRCHAGGHPPRPVTHPLPFTSPALHGSLARDNVAACQPCHGESGGAGSNARFNLTIGFLQTGCEGAACHSPYAGHPAPWRGHAQAGNVANACPVCHGATLGGGTGPACSDCHTGMTNGDPPVAGGCVSCHGGPPNGTLVPNRAGLHAKHDALPGVTGLCSSCHDGGGTGTAVHLDGVTDVVFAAAYDAKSGRAQYDAAAKTCRNVSCHGGVLTPSWSGGTIDAEEGCTLCHVLDDSQYNGCFSGKHRLHMINGGMLCKDCHDLSLLAQGHFAGLRTTAFEGSPGATLRADIVYTGGTCSPVGTSGAFSVNACHFTNPQEW